MSATLDELTTFLQQPTPRDIPPKIHKAARRRSFYLPLILIPLLFLFIGIVSTALIFPWRLRESLAMQDATLSQANGTVIKSTVERASRNDTLYKVYFRFTTPDGKEIRGVNFTSSVPEEGAQVLVEYLPQAPQTARIKGMRLDTMGVVGLAPLFFVLIGGIMLCVGLGLRSRMRHILRNGCFASARVTNVHKGIFRVNRRNIHKITFQFQSEDEQECTGYYSTTASIDIDLANARLKDGKLTGILYAPECPRRVLFADTLIGRRERASAHQADDTNTEQAS